MTISIIDILFAALNYLRCGGVVMIPLLVSSILMWAMIFNRGLFLRSLEQNDLTRDEAKNCLAENRFPDLKKYKGLRSQFVSRFLELRCGKSEVDKYILDETVMSMVSSVDRLLVYIGILASVSPLLGLLGTVIGMMSTFDIISIFGTGNAKAMAGGISEALISTQTGLLIAIPGLYMHNLLSRKAEKLRHRIASTGFYLRRFV